MCLNDKSSTKIKNKKYLGSFKIETTVDLYGGPSLPIKKKKINENKINKK